MRIAVDATPWFNERGYGRYARELLTALAPVARRHELTLLVDARDAERIPLAGRNVRVRGVKLSARPTDAASASGHRSVADVLAMRRAAREEKPDVLYYPTVYTWFPGPGGTRAVVTIHDAIAERFPALTLPSLRARLLWRTKVKLALAQARLVLTVSDFAAGELVEVLRVDRRLIRVTGEAPSATFRSGAARAEILAAAERAGLPAGARWITYVGGFNPHKNVDRLVRAHARLARDEAGRGADPPHLVLVGTRDRDVFHTSLDAIEAAVQAGGVAHLVHWPGFVQDEELRALHCGALCSALPSECEGFGLPAVEAAACGTPVVATTRSPLPRLLPGGGIFVDPGDEEGLFAALATMTRDEGARAAMGHEARARASSLSWDRAAAVVLAALEEAVQ